MRNILLILQEYFLRIVPLNLKPRRKPSGAPFKDVHRNFDDGIESSGFFVFKVAHFSKSGGRFYFQSSLKNHLQT